MHEPQKELLQKKICYVASDQLVRAPGTTKSLVNMSQCKPGFTTKEVKACFAQRYNDLRLPSDVGL